MAISEGKVSPQRPHVLDLTRCSSSDGEAKWQTLEWDTRPGMEANSFVHSLHRNSVTDLAQNGTFMPASSLGFGPVPLAKADRVLKAAMAFELSSTIVISD